MKKLSRLTALLLALMMLVTSMPLGALADAVTIDVGTWNEWVSSAQQAATEQENETETVTTTTTVTGTTDVVNRPVVEASLTAHAGTETSAAQSVSLPIAGKLVLHAYSGAASYQWQVKAGSQWANIMGDTGAAITLTYAKIQNAMSGSTAQVRCVMTVDGESYVSATAQVSVDESVTYTTVETQSTLTVTAEQPVLRTRAITAADAGIMLADAGESTTIYNVVIKYLFKSNGKEAATSYIAQLVAGQTFEQVVTSPTVTGYAPDKETVTISYDGNSEPTLEYVVYYSPAEVTYTVKHYFQNKDDDGYTLDKTQTLNGKTESTAAAKTLDVDGFAPLLYETPAIAADGSTVVEIYYDRNYYLMNFDLGEGGYGVEPIYARYGAKVEVGTPKREGYNFVNWTPAVPDTVPVGGGTYTANWQANDTAKVTVVFWGENPNDEEYSYLGSGSVTAQVGTQYTYGDTMLDCAMDAHTHTDACLDCEQEEHEHSLENNCYTLNCDKSSHTHTWSCYPGASGTKGAPGISDNIRPSNGDVEHKSRTVSEKVIYVNGTWYNYTGEVSIGNTVTPTCGKTEGTHTHSIAGGCYALTCTKTEHTHDSSCYGCGKVEHTHDNDCKFNPSEKVPSNLWKKVKSETKEVLPDGTTVVNVYYDRKEFTLTFKKNSTTVKTITRKWGADIHSEFPITDNGGTIQWTVPDGCTSMAPGKEFASLDSMPAENITFKYYTSASSVTLYYYIEALPGETVDYTHGGKNFKSYKAVDINSGVYLTYTEEFHDITGFKQWWSDPAFDKHEQGGRTSTVYDDCVLCYTRNTYAIEYYNPTTLLKTDPSVSYQMPLTTYAWTPTADQAPVQYEPGSVEFEGWYLNPECTGEKFDFTTAKMPSGPNNVNGEVALSLYAKWVPVTHTVDFYLDYNEYDDGKGTSSITATHPQQQVKHGELAATVENPTNGSYTFVGWFYMDNGTEKAFDFDTMPVKQNLDIYAKWSSNVLVDYEVRFLDKQTNEAVADPIIGSGLATASKTFEAKIGDELDEAYRDGYFPTIMSQNLVLSIPAKDDTDANVITFYYVKTMVPYTVYYVTETQNEESSLTSVVIDGTTYYIVANTEEHKHNTYSYVTETFKKVNGYVPDAVQKSLALSVNVDSDDNVTYEDYKIIFVYSKNEGMATYTLNHYLEDGNGGWRLVESSSAIGYTDKGDNQKVVSADPKTYDNYTYDESKTTYQVGNDRPEKYVEAIGLTSDGLVINHYYTEKEATINYVAVGPEGLNESGVPKTTVAGSVNPTSEKVKVVSGEAQGSTATPASNVYKFVGWYSDAKCTMPVDSTWVDGTKITPQKQDTDNNAETPAMYESATYYAKFEYNLTTLTIKKEGMAAIDEGQSFLFNVTSTGGVDLTIAINGNHSETISGLTVGDTVTVTEVESWSWRYTAKPTTITLKPNDNVVTISNNRDNSYWLDGDCYAENVFGTITTAE